MKSALILVLACLVLLSACSSPNVLDQALDQPQEYIDQHLEFQAGVHKQAYSGTATGSVSYHYYFTMQDPETFAYGDPSSEYTNALQLFRNGEPVRCTDDSGSQMYQRGNKTTDPITCNYDITSDQVYTFTGTIKQIDNTYAFEATDWN